MKNYFSLFLMFFACSQVFAFKATDKHKIPLNFTNKFFADTVVLRLATISNLTSYNGRAKAVIVQDSLRGGIFNKLPKGSITADNGITFASNKTDSLWFRQIPGNMIFAEWYGTNDGVSLQAAINTAAGGKAFIVGAKSTVIVTLLPIIIPAKNYSVNLINTTIEPGSTFPNDSAIVKITGVYLSNKSASIYTAIKVDGLDSTKHRIGIQVTANLLGDQHTFYVRNCKYGVFVNGPCEKQNFNIGGNNCMELVRNTAAAKDTADYTPDENVFNITGSQCVTYFHDLPGSQSSYQVKFNVENTSTPLHYLSGKIPYAVVLEGDKLAKLSGEIRGSNNGGVYINGVDSTLANLDVEFDGLHLHQTKGATDVKIDAAKQVNGTLYSSLASKGGVYLGNIGKGGILNLNISSLTGGVGLQLGKSGGIKCRSMIINYIPNTIDTAADALDIYNALNCTITAVSIANTNKIKFIDTLTNVTLNLNSDFIANNVGLITTGSVSTATIVVGGALTTSNINSYSTPVNGMRALTVTDKNFGSAYYGGSGWIYESQYPQPLTLITGINTKSAVTTALYTVPSGKKAYITSAIVRCTAASGISSGPVVDISSTTSGTVYGTTTLVPLTGVNNTYTFVTSAANIAVAAGDTINFDISSVATGTSQTVEVTLLGYLR